MTERFASPNSSYPFLNSHPHCGIGSATKIVSKDFSDHNSDLSYFCREVFICSRKDRYNW